MLPFESDNRAAIATRFSTEFSLAKSLIDIAHTVPAAVASSNPYTQRLRLLVAGIVTCEVRRYRCTLATLELGYAENAAVLGRALYEGLLAERFVLRSPTTPWEPGDLRLQLAQMSPDRRAMIYCSFVTVLQKKWHYERIAKTEDVDVILGPEWRQKTALWAADVEKHIGREWVERPKGVSKSHYSGLSIEKLAEYCDLSETHRKYYPILCASAHANDGLRFVEMSDDSATFHFGGSDKNFTLTFVAITSLFAMLLADVSSEFGLGLEDTLASFALGLNLLQSELA